MKSIGHFLFIPLTLSLALMLTACNPNKAESLLGEGGCTLDTCDDNTQNSIDGELSISADSNTYQQNVDQGDVVEISGTCTDLGIRENHIQVQVFESEDVSTEVNKYLDNDISYNCENSTKTLSLNNQKCIWTNQGLTYIPDALQPTREFPQCFNGRFSFSVRLGRIIRNTEGPAASSDDSVNPRTKYTARFRMITHKANENAQFSQWAYAYVDRGVSKVSFFYTALSDKANIYVNAFKNLTSVLDIRYSGTLTREYIGGNLDPALSIYPTPFSLAYPASTDISILDWNLQNMGAPFAPATSGYIIPGVKHKIAIKAQHTNRLIPASHDYTGLRVGDIEESQPSDEVVIDVGRSGTGVQPGLTNPVQGCAQGQVEPYKWCQYIAPFPSVTFGYLEWMIAKGKIPLTWAEDYQPATLASCAPYGAVSGISAVEACNHFEALPNLNFKFSPLGYPNRSCTSSGDNTFGGSYTVAVRFSTTNLPGAFKGKWSTADAQCVFTSP